MLDLGLSHRVLFGHSFKIVALSKGSQKRRDGCQCAYGQPVYWACLGFRPTVKKGYRQKRHPHLLGVDLGYILHFTSDSKGS